MKKILLGLLAIACVVPALALAAADPKPNSHFSYCSSADVCPLSFSTNDSGGKIVHLVMYDDKCSKFPPLDGYYPKVRVKGGKFSKEGDVENVVHQTVHFEIHGKFKRPKKAVGEYTLSMKGCSGDAIHFVAKRDGKAA